MAVVNPRAKSLLNRSFNLIFEVNMAIMATIIALLGF